MKNLFILHTQYNIITGVAVINQCFKTSDNTLLLLAEFDLNENHIKRLEQIFSKVIIAKNKFTTPKYLKRFSEFKQQYMMSSEVFDNVYDNVFVCQERYLDTLILSKLANKHKFNCCSVEEDCYYSWNNVYKEKWIKKILHNGYNSILTLLYGKNIYYTKVHCYGMNPYIDSAFLMFPQYVREEIVAKEKVEINTSAIKYSIHQIYNQKISKIEGNCIIFFFDLISRYEDKHVVEAVLNEVLKVCKINGWTLGCKYHPREIEQFDILQDEKLVVEINSIIPAEKVLVELDSNSSIIIGSTTTSISVARKLGFKVLSIAPLLNVENVIMMNFFENIKVETCKNIKDLTELINS